MSGAAHLKAVFAVPLVLALLDGALQAQPAFRVKDLNTTRSEGINSGGPIFSRGDDFVALGRTVLFPASDGINGFELWGTDGTAAGTRLIADICPGSCTSSPRSFAVVGARVFFVADDGFHGPELWRSDGTTAGTVQVKDLIPVNASGHIHGLIALNGKLLFSLTTLQGRALWRSDGTVAGTVPVAGFPDDFRANNSLEPLGRLGTKVFFYAEIAGHGQELWVTDGTTAGTSMLRDLYPGPFSSPPGNLEKQAAVAGGKLFFLASSPQGFDLYKSDGTPAGTVLVKDFGPGQPTGELTAWGREVFFLATDGQGIELVLWRSDGTDAGTRPVTTVPGNSRQLTVAGGRLHFFADCELWRSDGTAGGTVPVMGFPGVFIFSCELSKPLAGKDGRLLFFANDGVHGREPWKSDGTTAGTSLVADLNPGAGSSGSGPGLLAQGRWYFRAQPGEDVGVQLWTSDGTAANTRMLVINRQASSLRITSQGDLLGPRAFFDLNGTLLFQGGNGATGAELARSNGTAAGTQVVKDLEPSRDSLPGEFTRVGSNVFFRTGAGTGAEKLWKTDGTRAGTQVLFAPDHLHFGGLFSPKSLTAFGGHLLFAGAGDDFSETLLKSDGTPEGTLPLDESGALFDVESIVPLPTRVLFQGNEDLWTSDGTSAGTTFLGTGPSLPFNQSLAELSAVRDGILLFAGFTVQSGQELWRSDGTEAGTFLLAEIIPGPASTRLGPFAVVGSTLFFGVSGNELWRNDAAGTVRIRQLSSGGDQAFGIRSLTPLGNKVYFTFGDNKSGHELWVSDATEAGTRIVKDILPGAGSSHPRQLRVEGSILLFSASDGVHGFEPWRSDGTAVGTWMLQDIAPGGLSSSPAEFTASGPNIYFAANDGTSGFELWALPRQSLRARPAPSASRSRE